MLVKNRLGINARFEWLDPNTSVTDEADSWLVSGGLGYHVLHDFLKANIDFTHRQEIHGNSLKNDSLSSSSSSTFEAGEKPMKNRKRLLQRLVIAAALLAGLGVAPGIPGCADGKDLLRAKVVEDRAELIGGPVAMADLGDFLLENDQIRVNILGPKDSPGPGVFGGSIVDVDSAARCARRREQPRPRSLRRALPASPTCSCPTPRPRRSRC